MPLNPHPPTTEEFFPSADAVCDALRRELNRECPPDIYQFCATYFTRKLQDQRSHLLTLVKVGASGEVINSFNGPRGFGRTSVANSDTRAAASVDPDETSEDGSEIYHSGEETLSDSASDPASDPDDSFLLTSSEDEGAPFEPPAYNRGRRTSISAESMAPAKDGEFVKVFIPKSPEQRMRIETCLSNNFLFKNLDEEQYRDVIDAMSEKRVAPGEDVIVQGGVGDYFYAVEAGTFAVYVAKDGGPETKVHEVGPGGSFGELALMYNAPRAATVRCGGAGVLWALDRVTFRRILMERTARKRRMYEGFLEEVPILTNLEPYERHKIADALEPVTFNAGDVVVQQGDTGQSFYIIESGEATVTKVDENGVEHPMGLLKKGDYFGELALLTDKARKATVSAVGRLKCATLGKKAFVRLLGPVVEIIKRNSENYAQTAVSCDPSAPNPTYPTTPSDHANSKLYQAQTHTLPSYLPIGTLSLALESPLERYLGAAPPLWAVQQVKVPVGFGGRTVELLCPVWTQPFNAMRVATVCPLIEFGARSVYTPCEAISPREPYLAYDAA
ncbi:hypothetical protein L0F63_000223, partial [Massospora cicadina]